MAGAPVLLADGSGSADADLADLRGLLTTAGRNFVHARSPGWPEAVHVIAAIAHGRLLHRSGATAPLAGGARAGNEEDALADGDL